MTYGPGYWPDGVLVFALGFVAGLAAAELLVRWGMRGPK